MIQPQPKNPIARAALRIEAARQWLERHQSLGVPEANTLAEAFTELNQQNMAMRMVLGSFLPVLEQRGHLTKAEILHLLAPVGRLLILGTSDVVPLDDGRGN
jgi:hypothetical protein